MKAFVVHTYGGNDHLKLEEFAKPKVGKKDVLVRVTAASVNPVDYRVRNGEFKLMVKQKMPFVLGFDFAGVVEQVGSTVTQFKAGDKVYGLKEQDQNGSFAEYIAIPETTLAPKPKNLSMEEAASIPLVGLTAWQALIEIANVKKGSKVFIQAGTGGVGSIAIQIAKSIGATVATTVSRTSTEMVKKLGADIVIDYRSEDFEDTLKDYDMVLNSQDTKTLSKSFRIMKRGGNIVSISGPPTPKFAVESGTPKTLKLVFGMLSLKARQLAKKHGVNYTFLLAKTSGMQLRKINNLIENGSVKPVIDKVYPFNETKSALSYVESGRAKGKVVIKIQP